MDRHDAAAHARPRSQDTGFVCARSRRPLSVCVALVAIWLVAPAAGDMTAAGGLAALAGGACLVASGALAMRICEAAAFGKPTEVEHV